MKELFLSIRSTLLWAVSLPHFAVGAAFLGLMGRWLTPRQADVVLRPFCRNIIRLSGARLEVRAAPGSRPSVPCFYAVNHVELFDPFIIVAATEGTTRGLELESHFRVPIYGWLMRNMHMVRVPDRPTRAGLAVMKERTAAALAAGINLVVYPEGTRTRTGHVGPFRPGLFRMAVEMGTPIVPVSVVGAFEHKRVGRTRLNPARIVVHLHPALQPGQDPVALCNQVRHIVMAPVEAATAGAPAGDPDPAHL